MPVLYAQFAGGQQLFLGSPTPIPGLSLTIPEGAGEQALIILNVPAPYALASTNVGGWFGLSVDGTTLPQHAVFSYNATMLSSQAQGRVPTTLVAAVPLVTRPQQLVALASGYWGGGLILDSPASLSVLI